MIAVYRPKGGEIQKAGGVMVMEQLVHDLRKLGADAHLAEYPEPYGPDIAIYAEGVEGNPLNARVCIKWLLYHQPTHFDYGPDEILFQHGKNCTTRQPELLKGQLYTLAVHPDIWTDIGYGRSGTCFVIRKGEKRVTREIMQKLHGATCIEAYPNLDYIHRAFNWFEYFVSLDLYTALSPLAALCGCKSIVMPIEGLSAEKWRDDEFYMHKYGVAYGYNDIEHAQSTLWQLRPHIYSLKERGLETVKEFIKFTQTL